VKVEQEAASAKERSEAEAAAAKAKAAAEVAAAANVKSEAEVQASKPQADNEPTPEEGAATSASRPDGSKTEDAPQDAGAVSVAQPQSAGVASDSDSKPGAAPDAEQAKSADQDPLTVLEAAAMLRQVDDLLKAEIEFLHESGLKFGTVQKPTRSATRKRKGGPRSGSEPIEPLAFDAGAVVEDRYRSPRTPKPNSQIFHADYTSGPAGADLGARMGMAPELHPYKLLLEALLRSNDAGIFSRPINELWTPESLGDYFQMVRKPMDLGTIQTNLDLGKYGKTGKKFTEDVRLVWKNCMTFNQPGTEYYGMAERMIKKFDDGLKKIAKKEASSKAAKEPKAAPAPKAAPKPRASAKPAAKRSRPSAAEKRPAASAGSGAEAAGGGGGGGGGGGAAAAAKKSKSSKKKGSSNQVAQLMEKIDSLTRTVSQHGLAKEKSAAPKAKVKTMELWEKEKLVRDMDRLDPGLLTQGGQGAARHPWPRHCTGFLRTSD
jgi:hypothetical protein